MLEMGESSPSTAELGAPDAGGRVTTHKLIQIQPLEKQDATEKQQVRLQRQALLLKPLHHLLVHLRLGGQNL